MNFNIVWKGTNNFTAGRGYGPPIAICDHIMEGTMESTDGWFKNPASQASSTFGVAQDGRIWQWVNERDSSWANGIVQQPDMSVPWIANAVKTGQWMNALTLSIEHEGFTGNPMPEAQYQATLWLHRKLLKDWNIPADRQHIIGHYQIDSVSRARCPGSGFPWSRLMQELSQPVPQPPAPNQFDSINLLTGQPERLTINEPFFSYWQAHGGIAQLGLPVTPEVAASRFNLGFNGSVQYFERARAEFHDVDQKIYLGRVGAELVALTK